jgi:hypothetical protein
MSVQLIFGVENKYVNVFPPCRDAAKAPESNARLASSQIRQTGRRSEEEERPGISDQGGKFK